MKRPLSRLISVALIVLCSIGASDAEGGRRKKEGVHTGPHWSSSTMSVASATAPDAESKASKPEQHHNGDGGKHDSGVEGTHPVKTSSSKAGKPDETPSTPNSSSWESAALSYPTTTKEKESKSGKASGGTSSWTSMSYAKSQKDPITSDSKADKGAEVVPSAAKPAPNEYNGYKMVIKAPEGGYKKPKSGKDPGAGESDGSWSSATAATADTPKATPPAVAVGSTELPVFEETTTTTTTTTTTEATAPAATEPALPAATTPQAVEVLPTVPIKRDNPPNEINVPTYSPTSLYVEQTSSVEETFTAMEPFGLRFVSSKPQPSFDVDALTEVTTEHLLHSFRTKGWDANRLTLMLLDDEDRRRSLRKLDSFPVHELVFGGILYFKKTSTMPSKEEENAIVETSFSGDRLRYYVALLNEKGLDVESASWGHLPTSSSEAPSTGGNGGKWALILGTVLGSIGLFIAAVLLVRLYNNRTRRIRDAVRPSLVFRIKDEVEGMQDADHRDGYTVPSSIDENASPSRYSYYSKQPLLADPVSPLDRSDDTVSTSTRYVSVFTVKKDCGGRTLEQVDLRSLAVAYLSRLFKKVPDTNLLPYDKASELPAIKSIRDIPEDMQELLQYVGNPRIDEKTGKVLFNLRCESDVPMSKMKNLSSQKLPKEMKSSTTSEDDSSASGFEDVKL